jgi:hypothetical protein
MDSLATREGTRARGTYSRLTILNPPQQHAAPCPAGKPGNESGTHQRGNADAALTTTRAIEVRIMAVKKRSTPSPLRRSESWNGGCYYLEGGQEDLIQSGEVLAEWLEFGAEKDDRGRCVRTRILSRTDRRLLKITDIGKGRFKVRVNLTHEEAMARYRTIEEQRESERATEAEKERQARLPKTEDEYRERVIGYAGSLAGLIDGFLREGRDGYRFDIATYDACMSAYRSMEAAIRRGRVISKSKAAWPVMRLISGGRR